MPVVLRGARFIRYTACLEIATVVARMLAWCSFSKSHHRPARVVHVTIEVALDHRPVRMAMIGPCRSRTAQRRRARVARAASAVAPVPFLNRILCRKRQFCTVFRIFTH